jgi:TPR repeat protein
MRTCSRLALLVFFAAFAAAPAFAFDGTKSTDHRTPMEAFRYGAAALKTGDTHAAVVSLEYAAENGHAMAQWKLGRMYAEGEGVPRDDLRAFEYFRRIADSHADDNPGTPQSRFVANAFVALGSYYLEGIPKSAVKRDPERAREMFAYAASYFGDADAQYHLGRLYLDGIGCPQDAKQAARWLWLSAQKGQTLAQALLGSLLFSGEVVPRQAARGLMWLTLAKDAAAPDQAWVAKQYELAFRQATEDERALALVYLQRWMANRRE